MCLVSHCYTSVLVLLRYIPSVHLSCHSSSLTPLPWLILRTSLDILIWINPLFIAKWSQNLEVRGCTVGTLCCPPMAGQIDLRSDTWSPRSYCMRIMWDQIVRKLLESPGWGNILNNQRYSFQQLIFIEHISCYRHCSRCLEYRYKQE